MQCNRKFKYAQVADLDLCEREVIRMLRVMRHVFYQSGVLLIDHLFTKDNQELAPAKSFIS